MVRHFVEDQVIALIEGQHLLMGRPDQIVYLAVIAVAEGRITF